MANITIGFDTEEIEKDMKAFVDMLKQMYDKGDYPSVKKLDYLINKHVEHSIKPVIIK